MKQQLTPIFENFRTELDEVFAKGDTVVYDAVNDARKMLVKFRPDLQLRRRIIIVSDGDDTGSITDPKDLCKALQLSNIIVDSVQVGQSHNSTLHAISVLTGKALFHKDDYLGTE